MQNRDVSSIIEDLDPVFGSEYQHIRNRCHLCRSALSRDIYDFKPAALVFQCKVPLVKHKIAASRFGIRQHRSVNIHYDRNASAAFQCNQPFRQHIRRLKACLFAAKQRGSVFFHDNGKPVAVIQCIYTVGQLFRTCVYKIGRELRRDREISGNDFFRATDRKRFFRMSALQHAKTVSPILPHTRYASPAQNSPLS